MPLITIPATKLDYAVARMAARHTNPLIQNCARAATWPAGGKVLGAICYLVVLARRTPKTKGACGPSGKNGSRCGDTAKGAENSHRPRTAGPIHRRPESTRCKKVRTAPGLLSLRPFSTYWSRSVGLRRRISEACATYLAARHHLVSNACRSSSALDERRSYRSLNGGCDRAGNSKTFQTSWRRGLAPESQ